LRRGNIRSEIDYGKGGAGFLFQAKTSLKRNREHTALITSYEPIISEAKPGKGDYKPGGLVITNENRKHPRVILEAGRPVRRGSK